jgi:hypothetical protein
MVLKHGSEGRTRASLCRGPRSSRPTPVAASDTAAAAKTKAMSMSKLCGIACWAPSSGWGVGSPTQADAW